jgi:HAD superfamily hydrolase (TIGR01509 family)
VTATPVINLVVFDMDDVLCIYDFPHRLSLLARMTGLESSFIEKAIWTSGYDEECDRGRFTAEAYLAGFSERLGVPLSRKQWIKARKLAMTPDQEMLGLARQVSLKTEVAMLTNNGPLLKQALPGIMPEVADIFGDHAYFSSDFGAAKPNPEVFHQLLEHLNFSPAQTLFIDDQEEYIRGAINAGLQTHHFQGAAMLRSDLSERGLI